MIKSSLTCHAMVFLFGSPQAVERAIDRIEEAGRTDPSMALEGQDMDPLFSPFGVEGRTWASISGAWRWEVPPNVASMDKDQELKLRDRLLVKRLPQEETLLVARVAIVPGASSVDVRLWGTGQLGEGMPVYLSRFDMTVSEDSCENMAALLKATIQKFGSAKVLVDQAIALRRHEVLDQSLSLASSSVKARL